MAQILASGTTQAESTSVVLASGESATLSLFGTNQTPESVADIQKQASSGAWVTIGQLRFVQGESSKVLTAVGTFRVQRRPCSVAFGVDQD